MFSGDIEVLSEVGKGLYYYISFLKNMLKLFLMFNL